MFFPAIRFVFWLFGSILPLTHVSANSYSPFDGMIQNIDTVDSLADFMHENFSFESDEVLFGEIDYWQNPGEFWMRKRGDCEDYALFTHYVLEKKGIESYLVSIYGKNAYAHTVTIFREGSGFNVFNEDRLYRYQSNSIEDALSEVNPDWIWGAIASEKAKRGWLEEKLTKIAVLA